MKDAPIEVSGSIRDIFAHRFVLRTEDGPVLCDIGPKGAEKIALKVGDEVTIEGERKPSEIKVFRLVRGAEVVDLSAGDNHKHGRKHEHHPGHDEHGGDAEDPQVATRFAQSAGLIPVGHPRRKPKHFEILARDPDGRLIELHVAFDGTEKKRKSIEDDDDKWSEDIKDEP